MNIHEKLYNVMVESEGLTKDMTVGTNQRGYKAVSEKEILNKVKPLFKKYKLIIFPIDGDISETVLTYEKKYGGEVETKIRAVTSLKVKYRIFDIDNGEYQDVVGFGNGADSQDKGAGKASTYSFKNALCKTLMLFSGDDTDNTHSDDIDNKTSAEEVTSLKDTVLMAYEILVGIEGSRETANEKIGLTRAKLNNIFKANDVEKLNALNQTISGLVDTHDKK